jgi:HPt (histidine-containing phosphotransfer) domain-containing protein
MQQSSAKSLFIFQGGLDNDLLYELYELDYTSVLQTFQIFLDEIDSNILELEQFFKVNDISFFRKTIHRIKPVFSYIGLSELFKLFHAVEDKCNGIVDLKLLDPSFPELVKSVKESVELIKKEKIRLEIFNAKK